MSRESEYVKKCPPNVRSRIDEALNTTLYVLQESGPLAFTLGVDGGESDSDSRNSIFKVKLGSKHICSCKRGLSCIHILWTLVKIFHVSAESDLLWQTSLTEREVDDLISRREDKRSQRNISIALPSSSSGAGRDLDLEAGGDDTEFVAPRPIESCEDVCPICQDTLIDSQGNPSNGNLIHCKRSCGNNLHVKCLKILINHQKSLQLDDIKCPLCRNTFGSIEQVMADIDCAIVKKKTSAHIHYGMECIECHQYPIKGTLYKCKSCLSGVYLCETCFTNGAHDQHAFESKAKSHFKWNPAQRAVVPKLPDPIARSLEHRDLTQQDYEMLLTLDSGPQHQGTIPIHVINAFPLLKLTCEADKTRVRLDASGDCKVCALKIRHHGEVVRQIPCGHGFHRECIGMLFIPLLIIDRWLINSRSTCPCCGVAAYTFIEGQEESCIPAPFSHPKPKRKKKTKTKGKEVVKVDEAPLLMIRGSDALPFIPRVDRGEVRRSLRRVLPPIVPRAAESPGIDMMLLQVSTISTNTVSSAQRQKRKEGVLEGRKTFGRPPSISSSRSTESQTIDAFADLSINSKRVL